MGSNKQYPLTIERVKEIIALNAKGIKPEELEAVEIQVNQRGGAKTVEMGFVNDVGQIQLSSLKGNNNKKKKKSNKPSRGSANAQDNNRPNANRPQQNKPTHNNRNTPQNQGEPAKQTEQRQGQKPRPKRENNDQANPQNEGAKQHLPNNQNAGPNANPNRHKSQGGQKRKPNNRRPRPEGGEVKTENNTA